MIHLYCFIFCSIFSTISFYLYKFTNKDKIIGLLLNKSSKLIEILKLGITSIILFSFVEKNNIINIQNFISIKGISLLVFIIAFSSLYFIFNKVFRFNNTTLNFLLLYFSLFLSYLSTFLLINSIYLSLFIKITGIFSFIICIFYYFLQNLQIKKSDSIHSGND
jgi:hypothetical protein